MGRLRHEEVMRQFQYGVSEDAGGSSLRIGGDTLFWHGTPLAVRRDWGAGVYFLINGDSFSGMAGWGGTNEQMNAIHQLLPNVQIPFSALRGARLTTGQWDSKPCHGLKIVNNREDTHWNECPACGRKVSGDWSVEAGSYVYFHMTGSGRWEQKDTGSPMCTKEDGTPNKPRGKHILGAVLIRYENRYFLSSVDEENRRSYFLVELGKKAATVDEAFSGLAPQEVKTAEIMNRPIQRQGEVYCIETTLTDQDIKRMAASKGTEYRRKIGYFVQILGIRHYATRVVEIKNRRGRVLETYVSGTLRHATHLQFTTRRSWGRGGPEHNILHLGSTWWKAVKNTVKEGWTSVGRVD
jgi:hypothetical protein